MQISNKTYDTLKNIALLVIPFIAFVSTLCTIWDVPYSQQITATLVALDTLLGAFIKLASMSYEERLEEAKRLNGQDSEKPN